MIDVVHALDLLEQCVAERGCGYVYAPRQLRGGYSTCLYVHNGKPDCIIGLALAKSGVPVAALQEFGGDRLAGLYSAHRLPVDLTIGALAVFRAAQGAQDQGLAWGAAFRKATLIAGRYLDLIPPAVFADAFDRYRAETASLAGRSDCVPGSGVSRGLGRGSNGASAPGGLCDGGPASGRRRRSLTVARRKWRGGCQ
jgi:hypothetical protein